MALASLAPRSMMALRTSTRRWHALRQLVHQIERLSRTALLLDLHSRTPHSVAIARAAAFDRRLTRVQEEIARELTALTVEALQSDLAQRERKRDA